MKKTLALALLLVLHSLSYAQQQPVDGFESAPPSDIRRFDEVPDEFREMIVNDERDLEDLVPKLTITGAEHLKFVRVDDEGSASLYTFDEWIDDVMTQRSVRFHVDNDTRRIIEITGVMQKDTGFSRTPRMSETEALRLTIAYVKSGAKGWRNLPMKLNGDYQSRKHLKDGEVWWAIGVELQQPIDRKGKAPATHDWFQVSPDGSVEPWVNVISKNLSLVDLELDLTRFHGLFGT